MIRSYNSRSHLLFTILCKIPILITLGVMVLQRLFYCWTVLCGLGAFWFSWLCAFWKEHKGYKEKLLDLIRGNPGCLIRNDFG